MSLDKVSAAMKIAMDVVVLCNGDGELLQLVVKQLAASTSVSVDVRDQGSQAKAEKPRGRSKRRSRSGSKNQPRPSSQGPSPKGTTTPAKTPVTNVNTPKPKVDTSGVRKDTWDNRLRSARQTALESFEAFKIKASEKSGAVLVNAYWTLKDQWANYQKTPFYSGLKADPLRGLPQEEFFRGLEKLIDAKGFKRHVDNHHFVIQNDEGESLRGSDVFKLLV